MPDTFYEPTFEPRSPVLTAAALGEYAYSDPLARAAHRAGMTQAQFIQVLLKERAELQHQLHSALMRAPGPCLLGGPNA